ncbi:hypothetical protein AUJ65_04630 [Candidatus Micrarchaeota archaeon CG1_02_51_15]|nr:MAG: hypothetical protein AUJ65_04630 [Candidatus Micrarchaeota archaeon CG1_02_51_15]
MLIVGLAALPANAVITGSIAIDASVQSSGYYDYGYGYPDYGFGYDYGYGFGGYGCFASASPSSIYAGESTNIYVDSASYGSYVDCGNGLPAGFLGCVMGSCTYSCYYPISGSYYASAYSSYGTCSPAVVNVLSSYAPAPQGTDVTIVVETAAAPTPVPAPRICTDGTPWGMCSTNNPLYCRQGRLIQKASQCGCPSGQTVQGDSCVASTCSEGTPWGECSSIYQGQLCNGGRLVEDAVACGCPSGKVLNDGICVDARPFCTINANSPQRAGSPVSASVQYADFAVAPSSVRVSCGNGNEVIASCSGTSGRGSCSASCIYDARDYPRAYSLTAYFNGVTQCSSSAEIVAPIATQGSVLARVTYCDSGAVANDASVSLVQSGAVKYVDSHGEAQFKSLAVGNYDLEVTAQGYDTARVSTSVEAGRVSVASACLRKHVAAPASPCGLQARLVSPVNCPSGTTQAFQLAITNTDNRVVNSSVAYNSPYSVSGPAYLVLNALESRIVTATVSHDSDLTGAVLASVNLNNGACTANVVVPLCVSSGIVLSVNDAEKNALPGSRACYSLNVVNRGPSEARVQLSANGDYSSSFGIERILLASRESRNVEYCVDVSNDGKGQHDFVVRAVGTSNEAEATVRLNVLRADGIYSNFGVACKEIDAGNAVFYQPIVLTNDGQSGDYTAEVSGLMPAFITQGELYNFEKAGRRTVYVGVRPSELQEGRENHVTLTVSREGRVFLQQDLCFRVEGSFASFARLSQSRVSVRQGESTVVLLQVRNTGTAADSYSVSVVPAFNLVTVDHQELTLQSRQDSVVEIMVAPLEDVRPGEYVVPVRVYSQGVDPAYDTLVKEELLRVTVLEHVKPTSLDFMITASEPEFRKQDGELLAEFTVSVRNNELESAETVLTLEGVPSNWTYAIAPNRASIAYSETKDFKVVLHANGAENANTTIAARLTHEDGRNTAIPIVLSSEKARQALGATGLFTLEGEDSLLLLLLAALIVIGIAIYAKTQALKDELPSYRPGEVAAALRS